MPLWPAFHRFAAGHRVGIQVAPGAHPGYTRDPGTGEPTLTATVDAFCGHAGVGHPTVSTTWHAGQLRAFRARLRAGTRSCVRPAERSTSSRVPTGPARVRGTRPTGGRVRRCGEHRQVRSPRSGQVSAAG
ncbi:CocE/NonD family hydrolase C-terminal non-catalytic domain-containing protein [Streptomyces griseofuscus]|uniref:CocE/NonD family hydrolase C-terminal non-catalytic domain-containing protein n=1 Tax=Streptomyces griseofuscus TaxID=146922 RepID=UPI0031452695